MKWYKMDCDAQENIDMKKLIDEWGWDWYGRYWAILGKIGMLVNERQQTFALQTNNGSPFSIRLLSNELGTTVERLMDFCKYLSDNRLIDESAWVNKTLIYCPKLKDRADEYTKKLLTNSRQTPDQEQNKKRIDKEENKDIFVHFQTLWDKYPNRQGKKNALRHFNSKVKTDEDLANIAIALDNYLKSGNVKNGFIKNGSTWFNEWQDWITPSESMMKGNNGNSDSNTKHSEQYERATFKHGEKDVERLRNLEATLRQRDEERKRS